MITRVTILVAVAAVAVVGALVFAPDDVEGTEPGAQAAQEACEFDAERALSTPVEELLRENDPALGNEDSEVIVVEFFDPNCPHCHDFHDTFKQVVETYEDRVRFHKLPFALWDYSLTQIEAMLVAERSGSYYEMVDRQMELRRNDGLSNEEVAELGAELGFDEERFQEVLERGPLQNEVQERRRAYSQAGVQSTPTVTINGETVSSRSFDCISQKIDETLAAAE